MKTLREKMDERKRAQGEAIGPEILVLQVKGDTALRKQIELQQRRGYVLESAIPQGRKRVVLTFHLGADR